MWVQLGEKYKLGWLIGWFTRDMLSESFIFSLFSFLFISSWIKFWFVTVVTTYLNSATFSKELLAMFGMTRNLSNIYLYGIIINVVKNVISLTNFGDTQILWEYCRILAPPPPQLNRRNALTLRIADVLSYCTSILSPVSDGWKNSEQ
jgi:hypothetical protein